MFQYYCYKCKHEWDSIIHVDTCPVCGSDNLTPTKIDIWHPAIGMVLSKMFEGTPFILDHCENNIAAYSAGYGKVLVILINFEKKEVSYIQQPLLTRARSKTVKFVKIEDIIVPKTFKEFAEIIRR